MDATLLSIDSCERVVKLCHEQMGKTSLLLGIHLLDSVFRRNAFCVLGACYAGLLLVLAAHPPQFAFEFCRLNQLPEWTAHVIFVFMAIPILIDTYKGKHASEYYRKYKSDQMIQSLSSETVLRVLKADLRMANVKKAAWVIVIFTCAGPTSNAPWQMGVIFCVSLMMEFVSGYPNLLAHVAIESTKGAVKAVQGRISNPTFDDKQGNQFWKEVTKQYRDLTGQIIRLWSWECVGGIALLNISAISAYAIFCFTLAVTVQDAGVIVLVSLWGFLILYMAFDSLYALAQITDLIQSSHKRSIFSAALCHFNSEEWSEEARADHARFVQYITTHSFALQLPILGSITETGLLSQARTIVAMAPVAMAYLLRSVGRNTDQGCPC